MKPIVVVAVWLAQILPRTSSCAQPLSAVDSLRVLREAQHAQWDFERHRRFGLPQLYTSQAAPCDLIGRFCLRHGGVPFQRIPVESLAQSRGALIRVLDSAAE